MAENSRPPGRWRARGLAGAIVVAGIAAAAAIGQASGLSGFFGALAGPNAVLYDLTAA